MSACRFKIVPANPNDDVGGGGCLCGESKQSGCTGPYAVFYASETDSNLSPHAVVSLECAKALLPAFETYTSDADAPDDSDSAAEVSEPQHTTLLDDYLRDV